MELSKKQKILIAAAFFAVIFLAVLVFMVSSYAQMEDDSYHDPHYKILLVVTDYIDESKL